MLLISAFFSRLFGRKQFFLICIVMFTVCSFLCGIATELWQIILFRVLQGFFSGGLQPVQLDYFKPEDRGKAFGLSFIAIIVAPVIGPMLGGWITDNYSWRWVFFINISGRHCDSAGDLSAAERSAVGAQVGEEQAQYRL
nr:Multidrug resistance protein MdtN [Candidatus Pantoea persica]